MDTVRAWKRLGIRSSSADGLPDPAVPASACAVGSRSIAYLATRSRTVRMEHAAGAVSENSLLVAGEGGMSLGGMLFVRGLG